MQQFLRKPLRAFHLRLGQFLCRWLTRRRRERRGVHGDSTGRGRVKQGLELQGAGCAKNERSSQSSTRLELNRFRRPLWSHEEDIVLKHGEEAIAWKTLDRHSRCNFETEIQAGSIVGLQLHVRRDHDGSVMAFT